MDGTNQLLARYLHGDEFDQTFARVDLRAANASERVLWYLTDHLNSVRLVLDETGAVLDQIAYDAFGNIVAQLNPLLVNPILFASRDFDAETGLYYNRARYLDPTTGRWTTQDPLGFAAGDANLYRYVGNMATMATDPSGNIAWFVVVPVAVVVAGLLNTETGASVVVSTGNFLTGDRFANWVAGSSNDWYSRFAHRVDRWSLGNQLWNTVGVIPAVGAIRFNKGIVVPGQHSTTSMWTKIPGIGLGNGQIIGRGFNTIVLIEGVWNFISIPAAAIYTCFDGGEE